MKYGDSFTSTLNLDITDTSHFPSTFATYLVMLESAIIHDSSNFVYHQPLFTKEISPFLFLKPTYARKSDISQQNVDMENGNDRSRFLNLLNCREKQVKRIIKIDLCLSNALLDSDSFDQHFKAFFNRDSTDSTFSFSLFDKNVDFTLKESNKDMKKLAMQAEPAVISVLSKYIDDLKLKDRSQKSSTTEIIVINCDKE